MEQSQALICNRNECHDMRWNFIENRLKAYQKWGAIGHPEDQEAFKPVQNAINSQFKSAKRELNRKNKTRLRRTDRNKMGEAMAADTRRRECINSDIKRTGKQPRTSDFMGTFHNQRQPNIPHSSLKVPLNFQSECEEQIRNAKERQSCQLRHHTY